MMSIIRCSECGKEFQAKDYKDEEGIRCSYCGARVQAGDAGQVPGVQDATLASSSNSKTPVNAMRRSYGKPNGTNVNLVLSAVVGAALACAAYSVVLTQLKDTYIYGLLTQRGWVQYAIILLTCWAAAILLFKYWKISRQRATFSLDVLPAHIGEEIGPDNARRFREHLDDLQCNVNHNFLVRRIARVLDYLEGNHDVNEVASLLKSHAEIDASCVQSSYTSLKVIIWAIPIFGFLGTVIGIGMAVAKFSISLGDMQASDQITQSLGPVVAGLAVAFDTTLLALLMSLVIMFPTSWLEKMEDDLLIAVDEYCHDRVLNRLRTKTKRQEQEQDYFRNAFSQLLVQHRNYLDEWSQKLGTIGTEISKQIVQGWSPVHKKLREAQESSLMRIQKVSSNLAGAQVQLASKVQAMQDDQVAHFTDVVAALAKNMEALQHRAHEDYRNEAQVVHEMARQLQETLSSIPEQTKFLQDAHTRYFEKSAMELANNMKQMQQKACGDLSGRAKALQEIAERATELVLNVQKQSVVTEAQAGRFKEMMTMLGQTMQALQKQAHEDYCKGAKSASSAIKNLSESVSGVKEQVKALQVAMSGSLGDYQETFVRISEACLALAKHTEGIGNRLTETQATQESAIEKLVSRLAAERVSISKVMQEQLDKTSLLQQRVMVSLAKNQEKLGIEMRRSTGVQMEICKDMKYFAGLEGLDEKLAKMTKILNIIGILIKQSNSRTPVSQRQAVIPVRRVGSVRHHVLQKVSKGGSNGSH